MLPATHDRAYQDFLILLTEFDRLMLASKKQVDKVLILQRFDLLKTYFEASVARLDDRSLEPAIASRWQSVQTEIVREYKLLSTDMLFLSSAKQQITQTKRIKSINNRLAKLIGYCQIMLKDNN